MYVKVFEDKNHSTLTIAVSFTLNQSMYCYLTLLCCASLSDSHIISKSQDLGNASVLSV